MTDYKELCGGCAYQDGCNGCPALDAAIEDIERMRNEIGTTTWDFLSDGATKQCGNCMYEKSAYDEFPCNHCRQESQWRRAPGWYPLVVGQSQLTEEEREAERETLRCISRPTGGPNFFDLASGVGDIEMIRSCQNCGDRVDREFCDICGDFDMWCED